FANVTGLFYQGEVNLQQDNYQAGSLTSRSSKLTQPEYPRAERHNKSAEVIFMLGYCIEKLGRFEKLSK
ncbi:MAG: hypothetical protein IPJ07_14595, partial [Acidobacteria bacterium]|nr:hypothetical protein [Acidobacteriota bacterium]